MLNDKDDEKYEAPDESEYHYSDDEVNYEAETESAESSSEDQVPATAEAPKTGILGRANTPSKRMVISLVVFLGLIFVVYKMVAPTTTVPTEITPIVADASKSTMSATSPIKTSGSAAMTPPGISQPTPAVAPVANANVMVQAPQAVPAPVAAPAPAPVVAQAREDLSPAELALKQATQAASNPTSPAPAAVTAPNVMAVATPTPAAPLNNQPATMPNQQVIQADPQIAQQDPAANTVIDPVSGLPMDNAPVQPVATTTPSTTDEKVAVMQARSEKMIGELQNEYTQKLTDFQSQNKNLQDQVQTLNSRIATMESQLNQLVQVLTQQRQANAANSAAAEAQAVDAQPSVEQRIAYSVQAIIPGRAWLKSDNGDTLTVAEGDTIKSIGRVTKIDPYDGIVEINTGRKMISLSYGNGS